MISIFVSLLEDPKQEEQFTEVYNEYIDFLNKIALGITNDKYLAEEAVNLTFSKVSLKFDKLIFEEENKPGSLKMYLREAVRNNSINLAKGKQKRSEKVTLVPDFEFIDKDLNYEMFADSEEHEIYLDAVRFILNMSYTCKSVLILRFVFNMELKDIAEELELPIGTVKSRLNRGIQLLKEYFDVENN